MTNDPKKTFDRISDPLRPQAVGIPWFEPHDYPAIRAMMLDRDRLPLTHAEWLQKVQGLEQQIIARGHRAVRVPLHPQRFAAWCAIRNLQIDAKARSTFAAEGAARQLGLT